MAENKEQQPEVSLMILEVNKHTYYLNTDDAEGDVTVGDYSTLIEFFVKDKHELVRELEKRDIIKEGQEISIYFHKLKLKSIGEVVPYDDDPSSFVGNISVDFIHYGTLTCTSGSSISEVVK